MGKDIGMLDRPVRVWEHAGEVFLAPPTPCQPFIAALKQRYPHTRYLGTAWVIPAHDAADAITLLYRFFPIVQDGRPIPAPAPPFADGAGGDPFAHRDLIPRLQPVVPALLAIYDERHAARQAFTPIAAHDPAIPTSLGFTEGYAGHWIIGYAARCFWTDLLAGLATIVQSHVQPDGTLVEQLTAERIAAFWLETRDQTCGAVPDRLGQRWYPPHHTLPIWIAALLACNPDPAWTYDPTTNAVTRTLPPWPLRRPVPLYRIDLKDAAHWQVSMCVLPPEQSRDGQEALLHLSTVNGVSKNRALWAAFFDGRREALPVQTGRQRHYPRRLAGRQQYVTDWNEQPLPTSGLSHLALTHRSAFEPELGQAFVHLVGNDLAGAPDLPRFAQQLSRALSLPFDLAWAGQLWNAGLQEDDTGAPLITPLPSSGCQGYWVRADEERWTRLIVAIQRGCDPATLADADLTITDIGVATRIADVTEHAGEGGDGDEDVLEG
jgi:hypothetical protein